MTEQTETALFGTPGGPDFFGSAKTSGSIRELYQRAAKMSDDGWRVKIEDHNGGFGGWTTLRGWRP